MQKIIFLLRKAFLKTMKLQIVVQPIQNLSGTTYQDFLRKTKNGHNSVEGTKSNLQVQQVIPAWHQGSPGNGREKNDIGVSYVFLVS